MLMMPNPNPMMMAYHERSDHGRDGVELDDVPICNCRELFLNYTRQIAAITVEQMGIELHNISQAFVGAMPEEPSDWQLGYAQAVMDTRDVTLQLSKDLT